MRSAVEQHIGMEFGLVQFPVFGTGRADPCLDLVFHQIGQVVVGAIPGIGLLTAVLVLYSPFDSAIDEEQIDFMPLGMGDLGELETTGRLLIVA